MHETTPIVVPRSDARAWPAWTALVPAAAFPVLFLHLRYQPKVLIGLGSSTLGIELSDVAVLAVVLAAVAAGLSRGWAPLRPAVRLWVPASVFVGLVGAATCYPLLWQHHYHFLTHGITAAKFGEYALLAPALPLLLRRREDANPLLWTAAGWSALASGWGLLQFAGLVNEFEGRRPLQREVSFLGIHDFAALSGAALAIGLAVAVTGPASRSERVLGWLAGAAGLTGLVLSGAVAGVIGIGLAGIAAVGIALARGRLSRRGALVVGGAALAALAGVLLMRNGEVSHGLRSLGIGSKPKSSRSVESYVERSLVAYIGARIFLDHPVAGVGWQGSEEEENYAPYLPAAHRRFPNVPEIAFPSPAHPWGVQNAYLQTLTDLGLIGAIALVWLFAAGLVLGLRAALRAPPGALVPGAVGVLWLLVAAGVWNGLGLVAGIPLAALTWLGFGLVAAATAWAVDERV